MYRFLRSHVGPLFAVLALVGCSETPTGSAVLPDEGKPNASIGGTTHTAIQTPSQSYLVYLYPQEASTYVVDVAANFEAMTAFSDPATTYRWRTLIRWGKTAGSCSDPVSVWNEIYRSDRDVGSGTFNTSSGSTLFMPGYLGTYVIESRSDLFWSITRVADAADRRCVILSYAGVPYSPGSVDLANRFSVGENAQLSWEPSTYEQGYYIYRQNRTTGAYDRVGQVSSGTLTWTDPDVRITSYPCDETRNWQVTAYNVHGESSPVGTGGCAS
ncbi:MAG TPA: hypothetical protein VGR37_22910 [Longimicrobiaceae bacterium]|nr:hypothetical protein [Longimicrobiaceae bacterium]